MQHIYLSRTTASRTANELERAASLLRTASTSRPKSFYIVASKKSGAYLGAYHAESAEHAMSLASKDYGLAVAAVEVHKITPRAPETHLGACLRYALCLLRIATPDDWSAVAHDDRDELLAEVRRLTAPKGTAMHDIEVARDQEEGQRFVEWLEAQGHTARLGATTGSYVDGWRTTEAKAHRIMTELWEAYCDSAQRLPGLYVYDNGQELIEFVADKDGYYCWAAHLQERLAEFESFDDMQAAYKRVCALPRGSHGMTGIQAAVEAMQA